MESISLIPYGCTKFRISMMPVTEETIRFISENVTVIPKTIVGFK